MTIFPRLPSQPSLPSRALWHKGLRMTVGDSSDGSYVTLPANDLPASMRLDETIQPYMITKTDGHRLHNRKLAVRARNALSINLLGRIRHVPNMTHSAIDFDYLGISK
jgi:hypothetical protein